MVEHVGERTGEERDDTQVAVASDVGDEDAIGVVDELLADGEVKLFMVIERQSEAMSDQEAEHEVDLLKLDAPDSRVV